MKFGSYRSEALLHVLRMAGTAVLFAGVAQGAQFQFGALVQAGIAGAGDWEIGVGNSTASPTTTASLASQWVANTPRLMQLEYLKTTNTVNVRVYDGNAAAGAFTQASFSPAGGAAVGANAMWTLPASSFFVQAVNSTILPSSIALSNITLSGVTGAINIIQPVQQISLTATRGFFGGTVTSAQTGDIVFQGDSNGNWRLAASVTLGGFVGILPNGNALEMSLDASAIDVVPEPGTWGMLLIGGILMVAARVRGQKSSVRV